MFRLAGDKYLSSDECLRLATYVSGDGFNYVGEDVVFRSPTLREKLVSTGFWPGNYGRSGAWLVYEVVRQDGSVMDVDRYEIHLVPRGAVIRGPFKSFPEHHSWDLPEWYSRMRIESI